MEQTTPQQTPGKNMKEAGYNSFTHIIDKGIFNFFVGLGVAIAIIVSLGFSLMGTNAHTCMPLFFFLLIALGFAYAFGGLGVGAASTKEEGFKVKLIPAIGASIVGSFSYIFPLLFLQLILKFLIFFIPRYTHNIQLFSPHWRLSSGYLSSSFCHAGTEFCFFNSQFGRVVSHMLDVIILCVGLAIIFSVINSIVASIKVMSAK